MHEEKTSKNETPERGESQLRELKIDETLDESFSASDPPSWTLGTDHRSESSEQNREAD